MIVPLIVQPFPCLFLSSKIVLIAIQDEASKRMYSDVYTALLLAGATKPLRKEFRGSFALIGFTGDAKPSFIKQVSNNHISEKPVIAVSNCYTIFVRSFDQSNQGSRYLRYVLNCGTLEIS